MQETTQPFLFDRDNLKQVFGDWRRKELLEKHGYKTLTDLYHTLIAQKSQWAEYILGLPGTGKTTFAVHCLWAQVIETKEDINNLLTLNFDKMVFITCDIEEEIAQNARKITLLHTSSTRVGLQRKQRDEAIHEGESETSFGRVAGSVARVSTDDSITISRLKTDYAEKSHIIVYKSNTPDNRDEKKDIQVKNLSDKKKYNEEWVVAASGKWTPAQVVHINHQLKHVVSLAQEKWLASFAVIGQNSWDEYDLGLTQHERIKIMNLELDGKLQFITTSTPKFIKNNQGKVIKIVPEKSTAILGKERLPAGFTEGTYEELLTQYPDFIKHKNAYAVKAFAGYNFVNIGTVPMEWSEASISATFIRRCLVEWNIEAIKPYLSPAIFSVLTLPYNLEVLQRRYSLIQERDQMVSENKEELIKKYKSVDPISKQPLVTKKWEPAILNKKHATSCKNRRDQAKIMTYLQGIDQMMRESERVIVKKYGKLIYAEENKLQF